MASGIPCRMGPGTSVVVHSLTGVRLFATPWTGRWAEKQQAPLPLWKPQPVSRAHVMLTAGPSPFLALASRALGGLWATLPLMEKPVGWVAEDDHEAGAEQGRVPH